MTCSHDVQTGSHVNLYWGKELEGKIEKTGCKLGYKSSSIPTSTTRYIFVVPFDILSTCYFRSSFFIYIYVFSSYITISSCADRRRLQHYSKRLTAARHVLSFCALHVLPQKDLARPHSTLPVVLEASENKLLRLVIASVMAVFTPCNNRPAVLLHRCVVGRSKKADFNNCIR